MDAAIREALEHALPEGIGVPPRRFGRGLKSGLQLGGGAPRRSPQRRFGAPWRQACRLEWRYDGLFELVEEALDEGTLPVDCLCPAEPAVAADLLGMLAMAPQELRCCLSLSAS